MNTFPISPRRRFPLSRWSTAAVLALQLATTGLRAQSFGLLRELYTDIPGNSVADLTGAPRFPDHPTSTQILTNFFETGPNEAENYGQRLRAFSRPPETGDVILRISSDAKSVP